jgi:hypothetical protein
MENAMRTTTTKPVKIAAVLFSSAALLMLPAMTAPPAFAANDPAAASAAIPPPSVLTFDQKLEGNAVTVKYAHLLTAGYLVVYGSDADGNPSKEPLGHVALKAGDHRDVKVELSQAPPSDTRLWTSLYKDKDGAGNLKTGTDASFFGDRPLSPVGAFTIQ